MKLTASLGLGAAQFSARSDPPPVFAPVSRRPKTKHALAGYGTLRAVLEFSKWAHEQDRFPTIKAVCTRFSVCRATAYRWTSALAETYGIDTPVRSGRALDQ